MPYGADASGLANPGRDATALTIVRIDLSKQETLRLPVYRVIHRRLWLGVKHTVLFGQLLALAETWSPRWIACDATGVGAGLASLLTQALGAWRVIPFVFTASSKSALGWDFISVIETGRFLDHVGQDRLKILFGRQLEACQAEIAPGPGKLMRWGVPDGHRDLATGELVHDDLLVSAALCARLDGLDFGAAHSEVVAPRDPLAEMPEAY